MRFILLILVFLFAKTVLLAQPEAMNFNLLPPSDKYCIYEFTESHYIANADNVKFNEFVSTKKLRLELTQHPNENKEILEARVIENKVFNPGEHPFQIRDFKFPHFKDGYFRYKNDDFYRYLINDIDFLYEINSANSKIELLNREELLMQVRAILENKGFEKRGIDNLTTDFNTKAIPEITDAVQALYQVNSQITEKEKYNFTQTEKEGILTLSHKKKDEKPGIYREQISIHQKQNYLSEYHTLKIDSFENRFFVNGKFYKSKNTEKTIRLKEIKESGINQILVSGTIEDAKQKKVNLVFLRNAFGTDVFVKTVFLDENNSFSIETELEHPCLAFLFLGHVNTTAKLPVIPVYIEPGHNVHLEISGDSIPLNVKFSGDDFLASELVYAFLKKHDLLEHSLNFNSLSWRMYEKNYEQLLKAYNELGAFCSSNKDKMSENAFSIVSKELRAKLLDGLLFYLNRFEDNRSMTYYRSEEVVSKEQGSWLSGLIDTINIGNFYTSYGIFSRRLASDYLQFHFKHSRKVGDIDFFEFTHSVVISDFQFYQDLPYKIEMCKSFLYGHALYSELASILTQEKSKASQLASKAEMYTRDKANEYMDLMLRLCNDEEFSRALKNASKNQTKWEDTTYVPENQFVRPDGEKVQLKNIFNAKPTVVYVSEQWGTERYHFDDLTKENPEINFVMITEGSNFEEWTDYIKRAEPLAQQLFLDTSSQQLKDIFKQSGHHFIVYNKEGKRIGFSGSMLGAANLAKQSLSEVHKKQFDEGSLKTIIVFLSTIIFVLILLFFVWKYRTRQRFRKEEQKRKLRELELTAIRSQMNPHFLFNSLNSVQNLIQQNMGREAHLYLADFAGLIRKVLHNSEKEEVSLAEELEMAEQYLSLEKLRFDFDFSILVNNGIDINNTMVPSMLLQPFTENAVIHGLQNKPDNRKLKIEVRKGKGKGRGEGIVLSIEDNGIGRKVAAEISASKNGKGSKLIKERLDILQERQGENYSLQFFDLEEGTRVEIFIPEEN